MERKETQTPLSPHQLIMQDRKRLDISGVSDVDSFDDTTVIVFTSLGELTIKGQGFQVHRLDLEGGNLSLEGRVDALSYSENVRASGLFGKLFR